MSTSLLCEVTRSAMSRGTVLIVESHPGVGETLRAQCRRLGWAARLAPGDVGLAVLLRAYQPDAVICDLTDNDVAALATLRTLAHYDRSLPVLCVIERDDGNFDLEAPGVRSLLMANLQRTRKPIRGAHLEAFLGERRHDL